MSRLPDLGSVVIVVVVAALVGMVGLQVANPDFQEQMEDEHEIAEAYCEQAFGDPRVYTANAVMGHGGYHCVANTDTQHYHEVTEEARQAALRAEQNGEQVDWSEVDRFKDSTPFGRKVQRMIVLLPMVGGIVGLVAIIGAIQRRRNRREIEG